MSNPIGYQNKKNMKKKLFTLLLLILNLSCKTYKGEKVYFFDDSLKKQPISIRFKIPQRGLFERQEISSTSHIDRQVTFSYKDSSLFSLNTDIPAIGHMITDKNGIDEIGLYWRNFSNEKIIINYKKANEQRKAEFDKVIETAKIKLGY